MICCKIKEKKKLDTKEFLRKQQEIKISEGYNLINGAKLWYQIMWTSCDTIQARSNSDFDVKWATIQLYGNNHSSQSDRWMGLKVYVESPDMLSYLGLKFQVNWSSEDISIWVNRGCTNFVIYFLLTCGLPIWLGFFS